MAVTNPADGIPRRRPRRWRRLIAPAVAFVAVIAALELALQGIILPRVIAQRIIARCVEMNLPDAAIEVRGGSWGTAEFANLRLDRGGRARVASLAFHYSLRSLLRQEVEIIELTGVEVDLRVRNGRLDLGALADAGGDEQGGDLPFRHLELRASTLLLEWEGKPIRIPIEGSIRNTGRGGIDLTLQTDAWGAPLHITAAFPANGEPWALAVEAHGQDLAAVAAMLPPLPSVPPFRAAGRFAIEFRSHAGSGTRHTSLSLDANDVSFKTSLSGFPVAAEGLGHKLAIEWDEAFQPTTLRAALEANALRIHDVSARDVVIEVEKAQDRLVIKADAKGHGAHTAHFSLTLPPLADLDKPDEVADLSWQTEGRFPDAVVALLRNVGLDLSGVGSVASSGHVTAPLTDLLQGGVPSVQIHALRVAVPPGDLGIQSAGLALNGLATDLRATGALDADGLQLALLPESTLSLSGLDVPAQGLRITPKDSGQPVLEVALCDKGVSAHIPFTGPDVPLRINLPPIGLKLIQSNVALGGRPSIEGLSAMLRVEGTVLGPRTTLSLLTGSWVALHSAGTDGFRLGNARMLLNSPGETALIDVTLAGDGLHGRLACEAVSDGTISVKPNGPFAAIAKDIRLSFEADLAPEADTAAATLELEDIACLDLLLGGSAHLKKAALIAEYRRAGNAAGKLDATLTLDGPSVHQRGFGSLLPFDEIDFPPVTAYFDLATHKGAFDLTWTLQEEAPLRAHGTIDLSGDQPQAALDLDWHKFRLPADDAFAKGLADVTGLNLSGTFSLDASLRFTQAGFAPRVTLTAVDATLASAEYDARAEGIAGAVTLTGFSPLATPPNQRFKIRSLELGKLCVEDGLVAFRLEADPAATFIERLEFDWLGGRLFNQALRIHADDPEIQLRVFADNLSVGQLFELISGGDATGDGRLYGMLPVTLSASNPADLSFGRGFLYATPDGGWWQIGGGTGEVATQIMEKAMPVRLSERDESIRQRLVAGLLNFEFTTLKLDFTREPEGLLARLTTRGRSRDKAGPVEYEQLTFDFPRFAQNLRRVIIVKSGFDTAADRVKEAVTQ